MKNERNVCIWLADYLPSHKEWPEKMLDSKCAAGFLLVWPIYEQKLFAGFLEGKEIKDYARHYMTFYDELDVDDIAKEFHLRYQNPHHRKGMNLRGANLLPILNKPFKALTDYEKTHFLMHIVFRYRNNIFHGNKRIDEWEFYEKEINYCLQFMMALLQCAKDHQNYQS